MSNSHSDNNQPGGGDKTFAELLASGRESVRNDLDPGKVLHEHDAKKREDGMNNILSGVSYARKNPRGFSLMEDFPGQRIALAFLIVLVVIGCGGAILGIGSYFGLWKAIGTAIEEARQDNTVVITKCVNIEGVEVECLPEQIETQAVEQPVEIFPAEEVAEEVPSQPAPIVYTQSPDVYGSSKSIKHGTLGENGYWQALSMSGYKFYEDNGRVIATGTCGDFGIDLAGKHENFSEIILVLNQPVLTESPTITITGTLLTVGYTPGCSYSLVVP